ncbi:MAG: lycopene cyclase family protein [Dermatophilaceae bacterium]
MSTARHDVLVVGGGPAGRALAGACARAGLSTALVDPHPDRPFTATYGCWADELPAGLPSSVVAARARGRAIGHRIHELGWEYAVFDVPALRAHLDAGLGPVDVHAARAAGRVGPGRVALDGGGELAASVVVDAAGRWQALGAGVGAGLGAGDRRRIAAEQTAFGVVVSARAAEAVVPQGDALFMDWRAHHGEGGWPTFLYGIPLCDDRVLLEETSLARRPGLPVAVLRRRLRARLERHGIRVPDDAPTETVRFPVDRPRHDTDGVVGFGAAAPLVHPATGFSIGAALGLAQPVADAVATHLGAGPAAAVAAAQRVVWSPPARVVHGLRRIGLEAMLRMPPAEVPGFFDVFFALPERQRWAYLTGRADLTGTTRTMAGLFASSDWRLRRRLVLPALLPPLRENTNG